MLAALRTNSPLYASASSALLLCSILLLASLYTPLYRPALLQTVYPSQLPTTKSPSLAQRLERSEKLFQASKARRKELADRFAGTTESYPQQRADGVWPALTWWDYYYPAFNCPHELERIGAPGDSGKWVCGFSYIAAQPSCVIYSFGINYESGFEAELLERASNCQAWGYDFSVNNFGPEITLKPALVARSHFFPRGLAGVDDHQGDPPMFTLESLMRTNGHTFIDILKIDIETYEFEVMRDVIKHYEGRPLPFGQLQIEIHAWKSHFPQANRLQAWFDMLIDAGLRPFMNEPNLVYVNVNQGSPPELQEYSFINILGKHTLITE